MPRITVPDEHRADPFGYAAQTHAVPIVAASSALSAAVYRESGLSLREFEAARMRTAQINGCMVCKGFRADRDAPAVFSVAGETKGNLVTNNGPADAGNITLSDNVPAGSGFVSLSSPAGWKCTNPLTGKSGAITCTNTSLADGASAIFTIVASVNCSTPDGTVVSNTASVLAETPPDNNHSNDSQSVSLTVFNPAPVVNASVGLSLLPQNDHNLVNVGLAATATDDACPAPTSFVVQVFGDEDDQTPTDSSGTVFSPDAKDIAVSTLRLRQERTDSGDGRVYLIVVKASDAAGGTGFATSIVVVPKSSSAANISSINAQAAASKAFADTHSGGPPPGYFIMGDGPVIGPKQ